MLGMAAVPKKLTAGCVQKVTIGLSLHVDSIGRKTRNWLEFFSSCFCFIELHSRITLYHSRSREVNTGLQYVLEPIGLLAGPPAGNGHYPPGHYPPGQKPPPGQIPNSPHPRTLSSLLKIT